MGANRFSPATAREGAGQPERSAVPFLRYDLLNGAQAIADYLGWPKPRVQYMIRAGHLPVVHVGRRIYARKSELELMFRSEAAE